MVSAGPIEEMAILMSAMRGYDRSAVAPREPRIFVRPARPQSDRSESVILLPAVIVSRHLERILPQRIWHHYIVHSALGRMAHWIVAPCGLDVPIEDSSYADRVVIVGGVPPRVWSAPKTTRIKASNLCRAGANCVSDKSGGLPSFTGGTRCCSDQSCASSNFF
jgi:hypothetical protein